MVLAAWSGAALAQESGTAPAMVTVTSTVHGGVVNKTTKEPIARALVTANGEQFAAMTDDRGQFEITMQQQFPKMASGTMNGFFQARKPGFLPVNRPWSIRTSVGGTQTEQPSAVTIELVPEGRIVGHVNVPGSEGEVRIECQLYRREMREGRESWQPAMNFTSWSDGEFRFSELQAGTYKLITHEQMDRDSMVPAPGMQMYWYPPIYYSNTTDFSGATPIVVKAGETAQVNLTVERRAYYPVRIPVANPPAIPRMNLLVYPMGRWGPGWSLGYNPREQSIEGILPDGNYTVEADTIGQDASTGVANFSVKGAPMDAGALRLLPDTNVKVVVHEEFQTESGAGRVVMQPGGEQQVIRATVMLQSLDSATEQGYQAMPVKEPDGQALMMANVRPGKYRVTVSPFMGYAAVVESGGVDLVKQPLVVGMGGSVPPIEVTLRDDGGEVSGTVEAEPVAEAKGLTNGQDAGALVVELIPIGGGRNVSGMGVTNGTFTMSNVPPGDYLVVVTEGSRTPDLIGDDEGMKVLEEKGQKVHVEVGGKVNVRVRVFRESEE
jgi:hypothetical protein